MLPTAKEGSFAAALEGLSPPLGSLVNPAQVVWRAGDLAWAVVEASWQCTSASVMADYCCGGLGEANSAAVGVVGDMLVQLGGLDLGMGYVVRGAGLHGTVQDQ